MTSRQCSAIKHVRDVANRFHDTPEFKQLPRRISEMKKRLANERQSRTENDTDVDKSGDDCLSQIQTLRKTFNVFFDRVERRTISEMKVEKQRLETRLRLKWIRLMMSRKN